MSAVPVPDPVVEDSAGAHPADRRPAVTGQPADRLPVPHPLPVAAADAVRHRPAGADRAAKPGHRVACHYAAEIASGELQAARRHASTSSEPSLVEFSAGAEVGQDAVRQALRDLLLAGRRGHQVARRRSCACCRPRSSRSGRTDRLRPARSLRGQSPSEPRWLDGDSPALRNPSRTSTARLVRAGGHRRLRPGPARPSSRRSRGRTRRLRRRGWTPPRRRRRRCRWPRVC